MANGRFSPTNRSNTTPPTRNSRGPGRTNPRTAIAARIDRNATSGGMNPMLSMTLIVIRASTSAAIGMSHCAVLLASVRATAAAVAPAPSARRPGKRSIDCHADVLLFGLMAEASSGPRRPPSGGLPSRLLRGYCPLDGWERRRRTRADRRAVRPGRAVRRSARSRDQRAWRRRTSCRPSTIAQREGLVVVERGLVRFAPGRRERAYDDLGSHGQAMAHAHAAETLERVRPGDLAGIAEHRAGAVAVLGLEPALGCARRCRQRRRAGPRLGGCGTALEACGRGRRSGARQPRRPAGDPSGALPVPRPGSSPKR